MIGVLPQASQLALAFSALEVVMLGRLPHSTGRIRDREIAYAAMQQLQVEHWAQSLFPTLSGGEKQRLQLARVLCQILHTSTLGNRYLLLDEPTSALDLAHQHQTLQIARKLAKNVAILHDLNLAAQYADKILLLGAGEIVSQRAVNEILTAERIGDLYAIEVAVMPHSKHRHLLVVTC